MIFVSVNGLSDNKVDDKLFGVKTKMAQVQFFAWADHNQMPLRRIMVGDFDTSLFYWYSVSI